MKDISVIMDTGLALIGYLFIVCKAFEWVLANLFKAWDRRRTKERKEKAMNDLCEAFGLDELKTGDTVKIATKGGLVLMMLRSEGGESGKDA